MQDIWVQFAFLADFIRTDAIRQDHCHKTRESDQIAAIAATARGQTPASEHLWQRDVGTSSF